MIRWLMKWLRSDDAPEVAPEVIELRAVRDDLKTIAGELRQTQWGYAAALERLRSEETPVHG